MPAREPVDYAVRHESFERWYQTPMGRALLADQRSCVDFHLDRLAGARQLQVGISHRFPLASGTDFAQKIVTTPHWSPHMPDGVAVCDADELPFPGDSMDMVILHHTADFSPHPHQVLREASRVLRGDGSILLIGFNPVSLWGLRKLLSRSHSGPWGGRFMMKSRMEDWLRLLDFSIEYSRSCFYQLPLRTPVSDRSMSLLEGICGNGILPVGAYYCILAKKRVCSRIPRRPVWRQQKVIPLPGTGAVGASRGCANQPMSETSNHWSDHGR